MDNNIQKGHPKGLYLLFTTEMWERFSYYGMRAIFTLFLIEALMFDKSTASGIYGSYTSLVYLTPIIGGYFADNIWGNRKSIFVGGIMMAIGQLFMFLAASFYSNSSLSLTLMIIGLTSLIFGNGFFKPNISTLVGQLYSETDKRKDAAYTIFYMGINLGAFIAPLICGGLGERYDSAGNAIAGAFKWGFLAACIGMIISVITFELKKKTLLVSPDGLPVGDVPNKQRLSADEMGEQTGKKSNKNVYVGVLVGMIILVLLRFYVFISADETTIDKVNNYISAAIFAISIAIPLIIITDKSLSKVEKQRISVIYIVAFFVIFFWAAFEQAGASLTFFAAEQTDRNIGSFSMPASWFNSFNAVFIVILAPIISVLWTKLAKKGMEPASPYKQAFGLLFLALGYVFIAFGVDGVEPGIKVSIVWLTGLYLIHTVGELFLSPIGLSMVNKLAPVRFASLLMGVWFLSTAAANNFAGFLSSFYPEPVVKVEDVINLENKYSNNEFTAFLTIENLKEQKETDLKLWKNNKSKYLSDLPKEQQSKVTSFDEAFTLIHKAKINKDKDGKKIIETKYSSINFNNLFPESKNEKIAKNNADVIQEMKIDLAKKARNEEKSFIGIKITDLKSFFWLFVYLAGGSSLILFLLSKYLVKMMNGVK